MPQQFPRPLGRYILKQLIARGGMGEIYLAHTEGVGGVEKTCAIKRLPPGMAHDEDFIRRFLDEARVVTTLSHGNIAHVYEVGRDGDEFFLSMEYVDGRDLRQILARCFEKKLRIPQELGLYIVQELLRGLSYAHRKEDASGKPLGLIHRDVCPQNVMISFDGEVKLIDFGLAKSALKSLSTNPSILLGKVAYMSPEQARREKLDRRSDLYSAGIVLYEALTGRRRYGDAKGHGLLKIVREPGELIVSADAKIPPVVESILQKALMQRTEDRYQSAEEFRKDISSAFATLGQMVEPERLGEFVKKLFPPKPASSPKVEATRNGKEPKAPEAPLRASTDPQIPKSQEATRRSTVPQIHALLAESATDSSLEEDAPLLEDAPVTEVRPNPLSPEPEPEPTVAPSVEISPAFLAAPSTPEPPPEPKPAAPSEPVIQVEPPKPPPAAPVSAVPAFTQEPADLLSGLEEEEEEPEDIDVPGGATEVVPYPKPSSSHQKTSRGARILLVALFGFVMLIILGAGALFAVDPEGFRAWLRKNLGGQQSDLPPLAPASTNVSVSTSNATSGATSMDSLPASKSAAPLTEGPGAAQKAHEVLDKALFQKKLLVRDVSGLTRIYEDILERGEQNDLRGIAKEQKTGERLIANTSLNTRLVKKKEARLLKEVRAQKLEKKEEINKLLKRIKREKSIVRKNSLLNELNSYLTAEKENNPPD